MKISYYVKESFSTDFTGSLRKLEREIEDVYIQRLRDACFRERAYKENLLWQARYSGNSNLMNKVKDDIRNFGIIIKHSAVKIN